MTEHKITSRIDAITGIPENYRHPIVPAPRSVKIEITANCNYKCLRGDTLVDTIHGRIPIKELAEKYQTIPVYTYKDGEVFIADAINIRKTGSNQTIIRVSFDDGSHIDCTPDHRFLEFTVGGPGGQTREWQSEARDLNPGSRVRAYRENKVGTDSRIAICWGREFRRKRYSLVAEYMLGRKLTSSELVHHMDGNPCNDVPENLEVLGSRKDHFAQHPEIAQRMRDNNPTQSMTPEWSAKVRAAITGKTRSLDQRLKYRESKLGKNNPNYIDGRSAANRASRIDEINHKVVSVEPIEEREDVYCLEVPSTGWFFANKVLVKNCGFCVKSLRDDDSSMDRAFYSRVIREMRAAGVEELGMFYIGESFTCKWLPEAIAEAKAVGFPYVFLTTNGSASTPKLVRRCFEAGLNSLKFSINFYDLEQFEEVANVKRHLYLKAINNLKEAFAIREVGGYDCGIYASSIAFDGEQGEKMRQIVADIRPYVDEHYWLPLYGMSGAAENIGWKPQPGNPGRLDAMRPPLPCWAVFTEGHITAKGELAACCFGNGIDGGLVMADLNKTDFLTGWNSVAYQSLRSAHLSGDVSNTACRDCAAA